MAPQTWYHSGHHNAGSIFLLLCLLVILLINVHAVCFMSFSSTCEPRPCFPIIQHFSSKRQEKDTGDGGKGRREPSAWRDNTITCSWLGQAKRSGRLLCTGCRPARGRKREQEEEGTKERQMEEGRGRGDGIQPKTACTGNTIKLPADLLGQTHTTACSLSFSYTQTQNTYKQSLFLCLSLSHTHTLTHILISSLSFPIVLLAYRSLGLLC